MLPMATDFELPLQPAVKYIAKWPLSSVEGFPKCALDLFQAHFTGMQGGLKSVGKDGTALVCRSCWHAVLSPFMGSALPLGQYDGSKHQYGVCSFDNFFSWVKKDSQRSVNFKDPVSTLGTNVFPLLHTFVPLVVLLFAPKKHITMLSYKRM